MLQLYHGGQVLLVEQTGVPGENYIPATSHSQTLSHNVLSNTPHHGFHLKSYILLKHVFRCKISTLHIYDLFQSGSHKARIDGVLERFHFIFVSTFLGIVNSLQCFNLQSHGLRKYFETNCPHYYYCYVWS
jgi:hypothetical protein